MADDARPAASPAGARPAIILYTHAPVAGGVLRHVQELAGRLRRRGLDVRVVMNPHERLDRLAGELAGAEVKTERIAAAGWRDIRRLAAWWKLLRRERPAVVHFHQCAAVENIPAILLAVLHGAAVVLTEHLPFWPTAGRFHRRWLKRLALRRVRTVILLGPSLQRAYSRATGVPARRIVAIPPFSAAVPAGSSEPLPVIGFIGEFSVRKGLLPIIAMMPPLLAAGYRFAFYGQGPLRDRLQALASAWPGAVAVSSFQGSAKPALERMGTLLLPSSHEGLPLVVLEALSAGVPVLVTRVGVLADYLADGEGLFYLDEVSAPAVLEKLRRLEDPLLRRRLVQAGLAAFADRLSPAVLTERIAAVYAAAAGKPAG